METPQCRPLEEGVLEVAFSLNMRKSYGLSDARGQ